MLPGIVSGSATGFIGCFKCIGSTYMDVLSCSRDLARVSRRFCSICRSSISRAAERAPVPIRVAVDLAAWFKAL